MNVLEGNENECIQRLTEWLRNYSKQPTLLLVSGGSSAKAFASAWATLTPAEQSNFTISLADERFGAPNHKDSNWRLLQELGIDLTDPRHVPALAGEASASQAASNWQARLTPYFSEGKQVISILGMGDDSHIAGIKPLSPSVLSNTLVSAYQWNDFDRITLTPAALKQCESTIVYMAGAAKRPALEKLQLEASISEQPSQLLKVLPNCYILYHPDQMANKTNEKQGKPSLPPTVLTIFGITGNLSQIKLLPALYHLLQKNMLPENFQVAGVFRSTSMNIDQLMQQVEINLLRKHQAADKATLARLREIIHPITMDSTNVDDYHRLRELLDQLDTESGKSYQRLYYLAIPPDIFPLVISCLNQAKLHDESQGAARRILVEKPFGTNLATARELVTAMSTTFEEHQIYRIDHYLAKENAQNILTFRFNNPFVADIWGRQFIDHIQITATETIGIDKRGNFYEGMGATRDFVQSHLLQLMALTMMETPHDMNSDEIHREKLALLNAVQPIKQNHVDEIAIRGQYVGYREEVGNPSSNVETYAALCLEVANSRWGGVPILIRTGKSLADARTEINVVFKDRANRQIPPNILSIRIQPNEGIGIRLTAKKPGFTSELQPVHMQFNYQDSFDADSPDAYERVLVDTISGDQSLFASSEEVIRCWEILEPILEYWQYNTTSPELYNIGSSGPNGANALAQSFGSEWL